MISKKHLIELLNRKDVPGVGVVATFEDGEKQYYFYEDFGPDALGIDRAAEHFTRYINAGRVRRAEYLHKSPDRIHWWDWEEKPGSFSASEEFMHYNKCFRIDWYYDSCFRFVSVIDGKAYKYDYTPAIDGISAITVTKI